MPKIIRIDEDVEQNEPGFTGPFAPQSIENENVFVGGIAVAVVGDTYQTHICEDCCGDDCDITHSGRTASGGSPNVFAGGSSIHRYDDSISCGSKAGNGSNTVFANGE